MTMQYLLLVLPKQYLLSEVEVCWHISPLMIMLCERDTTGIFDVNYDYSLLRSSRLRGSITPGPG